MGPAIALFLNNILPEDAGVFSKSDEVVKMEAEGNVAIHPVVVQALGERNSNSPVAKI